ncbi:hypothetical protein, partial [Bradyrhizobium sp.]|uniref:hypothetical protein n=1 Tax=Bradyrhizobium sp. TaxID=376 RepID=UPI00261EBEB8
PIKLNKIMIIYKKDTMSSHFGLHGIGVASWHQSSLMPQVIPKEVLLDDARSRETIPGLETKKAPFSGAFYQSLAS